MDNYDSRRVGPNEYKSITEIAIQIDWKTPTSFSLCPDEMNENPIETYANKLAFGEVFCETQYDQSYVVDHSLFENQLVVITRFYDSVKDWAVARIWTENGKYYHKSEGSFFELIGAIKRSSKLRGVEYNIGDTFDDFC